MRFRKRTSQFVLAGLFVLAFPLPLDRQPAVSSAPGGAQAGPNEAAEFHAAQRLPPGANELPVDHLWEALLEIRAREADLASRDGGPPGDIQGWMAIGPGNIGGRTRALAIDPADPDILYAAGVSGGIFKSTDGGASWSPLDDQMLNLAVCTIALDPADPEVLYAGTGEGFGLLSFVRGLGIFKSTDGGTSWTQLPATSPRTAGPAFHYVSRIVISPNDPNRIYAGTRYGVYRSLDGGGSWSVVLANPRYLAVTPATNGCTQGCLDLAVRSDRSPDVLFAAFGLWEADGLFRSDDGGDTWTGYPTPPQQGRMAIAIAPSDNNRIYVSMAENPTLGQYGRLVDLWRADDGATFQSVLDLKHPFGPWLFSVVAYATGCVEDHQVYSQGWYDQVLAVDPLDPDVLWLGGIDLYRSDDGGATFGLAGYWFFGNEDPPHPNHIHADHHAVVFHPDYDGVTNQVMYVGNDGGVYRTVNARAATSQEECPIDSLPGPFPGIVWENLNSGYAVTQFYHGDVARDRVMFAGGSQDNGTSQALSAGTPNSWKRILGGDGGYVAIDPTNGDRIFASTEGFPAIYVSTDGGGSFVEATNGITDADGLFITPLAMDLSDPDVLWTGGSRPWRTTDGAASWEVAGPDLPVTSRISAVGIAPSDGNVVYLGFENGYLARTVNGLSPLPAWSMAGGPRIGAWVSSIAVDPADPDVAYCGYSNYSGSHIYRTLDGGAAWASIDGIGLIGMPDIPVHDIAIRPGDSQQLYAGTELGVFASDDGGATWNPANSGMAHTVVEALVFRDPQTLVAFTYGRGAFIASLDPEASGIAQEDSAPAGAGPTLVASPSPSHERVTLRASLPRAGRARLVVHDVPGRRVATVFDGPHPAGTITRTWDGRDDHGAPVPPGVYFASLETGGATKTAKIVLAK